MWGRSRTIGVLLKPGLNFKIQQTLENNQEEQQYRLFGIIILLKIEVVWGLKVKDILLLKYLEWF